MVRLAALITLLWAGTAWAECRLALVLALDVSSSVDAREYDLQRLGLAAALDAPEVRRAVLDGAPGDVALAVFEWSGEFAQTLHLDWTALRSPADIDRAVLAIGRMTRSHDDFPTAMGQALGYAATLLRRGPVCARQVIDLSGDGINNHSYGPRQAYQSFPFRDIVVNGLVVQGDDPEVIAFYNREVLFGPGAFLEIADGFDDFRNAMTRKLTRELSDVMLGENHAPGAPRRYDRRQDVRRPDGILPVVIPHGAYAMAG